MGMSTYLAYLYLNTSSPQSLSLKDVYLYLFKAAAGLGQASNLAGIRSWLWSSPETREAGEHLSQLLPPVYSNNNTKVPVSLGKELVYIPVALFFMLPPKEGPQISWP